MNVYGILLVCILVSTPDKNTLRLETSEKPVAGAGEMLLRTEYLSLDPYMRGRMNDSKSYAEPVAVGAPMVGGTVARVVTSDVKEFTVGDWVLSFNGWQENVFALLHFSQIRSAIKAAGPPPSGP